MGDVKETSVFRPGHPVFAALEHCNSVAVVFDVFSLFVDGLLHEPARDQHVKN